MTAIRTTTRSDARSAVGDAGRAPMPARRRRLLIGAVAVVVAGAIGIVVWAGRSHSGRAYADPASVGTITLYDATGRAVTHGNVHAKPFVWKAISSQAAPPAYRTGCKATLLAFQPREGVGPSFWSGDTLTASTPCVDVGHPQVSATATDFALADYLDEFPARWQGRVQLRVYLGAADQSTLVSRYATVDLTISGDTWTVAATSSGR